MPRFSRPAILMCPPDFYGIEYEINPWMRKTQGSDVTRARDQWSRLKSLLESLGAEIHLLPPAPGLPDLVFTANAGLVYRDVVYLSRFRHPERQGETPANAAWFQNHGFEPRETIPGDFEGAGDALFVGETLVADISSAAKPALNSGWGNSSTAPCCLSSWWTNATTTSIPAFVPSTEPRRSGTRRHSMIMGGGRSKRRFPI